VNEPLVRIFDNDARVKRILKRLPTAGPIHARAVDLLRRYRAATIGSLRALPNDTPPRERAELVELYQLGLLGDLGDVEADARLTPSTEGGLA
jgi:hypothetical protein